MSANERMALDFLTPPQALPGTAREHIRHSIEALLAGLPEPDQLSADGRRGIIARYTAVLEGNFIYWMTATYLSVRSPEAHAILEDNLREEVRDNHPGMLRRFAVAARGIWTESDRLAIDGKLQEVRAFVARLSTLQIVLMMAFFEGFIARFMPYLADIASRQGSVEREYTDVHGVGDIAHTESLFGAFEAEMKLTPNCPPETALLEGVEVLPKLIENVTHPARC